MKKWIVLALGLLFATPASAELTLPEKAQIRQIATSVLTAHESAATGLTDAIRRTTPATRADLGIAWAKWWTAENLLNKSIAYLIHANPEIGSLKDSLNARPIADWVGLAWAGHDAAIIAIDQAKAALFSAKAQPDSPAELKTAADAAIFWLGVTQTRIRALDRTLTYATPNPANYPRVIGPHGRFDDAMNLLALGIGSVGVAGGTLGQLYAGPSTFPDYAPFRSQFIGGVTVIQKYRHGLLALAAIPISDAECQMNVFQLVSSAFGPLASHTSESGGIGGAPYAFQVGLLTTLGPLFDAAAPDGVARAKLVRFIHEWTLAWRFGDGAIWQALIFPDPVTLAELREQGFPQASPFGPPLCPA